MPEDSIILSESEYQRLLEEAHQLQARVTALTALRDDLVYHVCPALRTEYEEKIASLERELLAANMYLREKQRIIELLQAQINRQKKPSFEKAQKDAHEEFKAFEEELKRKAKQAQEERRRWNEENRWSSHDRAEKEARERAKQREAAGKDGTDAHSGTNADGTAADGSSGRQNGKPGDDGSGPQSGKSGDGTQGSREGKNGDGSQKKRNGSEQAAGIGGRSRISQDSSDPYGAGEGDGPGQGPDDQPETPAQRLKHLYRKIVKRLHPDVNPNLTEHEKDLFNAAAAAYAKGDLEEMERIWDELSGMDAPEAQFEDTAEGRAKLREMIAKLKKRCQTLQSEIDRIRADFPYNMKAFLEDPQAVEQKRADLRDKIQKVREKDRKLAEYIEQLREQLKSGGQA